MNVKVISKQFKQNSTSIKILSIRKDLELLSTKLVHIKKKFEQPNLKSVLSLALYQKTILGDLQPGKYGWKTPVEKYDYEIGNAIIL